MSSRDAILNRIRTHLADTPKPPPPATPEVWPRENPSPEQLFERFAAELAEVQGELIRCASVEEARTKMAELAVEVDWKRIGAVDCPACREIAASVPSDRLEWDRADWPPQDMAALDAGFVSADWLLADTGSCVVECNTPAQRLMCFLPPVCIVVARTEQLFEHLPTAWPQIAAKTAEADRRGEHVIVTGPSRTADIEKILILGVHGPKRLIVLLVG